jgi:hypothetical protein
VAYANQAEGEQGDEYEAEREQGDEDEAEEEQEAEGSASVHRRFRKSHTVGPPPVPRREDDKIMIRPVGDRYGIYN